jgi:hypothetical protein
MITGWISNRSNAAFGFYAGPGLGLLLTRL